MAWLYKQKGSGNWWVGYRLNGKQFLRSTGTQDKAQAEREKTKLEMIDQAHKAGSLTEEFFRLLTRRTDAVHTLSGYSALWLAECKDLSPVTVTKYKDTIEEFAKSLNATEQAPLLRDIQPQIIGDFLREKRAKTSTATAKLYRKILTAFFNYAVQNQALQINPVPSTKSLKLTKDSKRIRRAFTLSEMRTIYDKAPSPFWRYMVVAGFFTGLRMGDLIRCPWGAVDFGEGLIRLTTSKTGKVVNIPFGGELRSMLWDLRASAGNVKPATPIWPEQARYYEEKGAGPFSNEFYDDVLLPAGLVPPRSKHAQKDESGNKRTLKTRKTNAISFHCMRHTFVSTIKIKGGSQAVAKELAGHSSDYVSDLYTHIPEAVTRKILQGFPQLTQGVTK